LPVRLRSRRASLTACRFAARLEIDIAHRNLRSCWRRAAVRSATTRSYLTESGQRKEQGMDVCQRMIMRLQKVPGPAT
jgi:hypothetical protein